MGKALNTAPDSPPSVARRTRSRPLASVCRPSSWTTCRLPLRRHREPRTHRPQRRAQDSRSSYLLPATARRPSDHPHEAGARLHPAALLTTPLGLALSCGPRCRTGASRSSLNKLCSMPISTCRPKATCSPLTRRTTLNSLPALTGRHFSSSR